MFTKFPIRLEMLVYLNQSHTESQGIFLGVIFDCILISDVKLTKTF